MGNVTRRHRLRSAACKRGKEGREEVVNILRYLNWSNFSNTSIIRFTHLVTAVPRFGATRFTTFAFKEKQVTITALLWILSCSTDSSIEPDPRLSRGKRIFELVVVVDARSCSSFDGAFLWRESAIETILKATNDFQLPNMF